MTHLEVTALIHPLNPFVSLIICSSLIRAEDQGILGNLIFYLVDISFSGQEKFRNKAPIEALKLT